MSSYFWESFLSDCRFATNCRILSRDRKCKETHKLLLSAISDDLRSYLLSSSDPTEEATIILPDFTMDEIEQMFSSVFTKDGQNDLFQVLGLFQYSKTANKLKPGKPKVTEFKLESEQVPDSEHNYKDEYGDHGLLNAVEQSLNVMEELNRESQYYDYYPDQAFSQSEEKRKKRKEKSDVRNKAEDDNPEDGAHICEYCDRKFKSEDSLFGHVTLKHPEKHEFLQYMLEVNGEFQCTICKKTYPKRRRCNIHIRSKHKIGAKLRCEVCQQVFYFKHELELHMVKHTQAKDAYCHLCGKGVRVAANLQRHMIAFHTNKAEKEMSRTFFCPTCGKGFFTSGALKEHEMLHSDAYNFQCSQCPKTFKQSAGLRTHFKRHHTNFEKTPEQKAKFAAYMQQYRARQREKDKIQPAQIVVNSQKKRRPGRSVKKLSDRSESSSPTMELDQDEDLSSRKSRSTRALTKLQAKEDANSLFMSNFDPSVKRKEKLKDKTYKDTNIAGGNKNTKKDSRKECLYDGRGVLLMNGLDVCDCLTPNCPGCHFPCPKCRSAKCGHECRNNRKWIYDTVELDGIPGSIKENIIKAQQCAKSQHM